jgi:hypothetical protein
MLVYHIALDKRIAILTTMSTFAHSSSHSSITLTAFNYSAQRKSVDYLEHILSYLID